MEEREREKKKNQLRRRMVVTNTETKDSQPEDGYEAGIDGKNGEEPAWTEEDHYESRLLKHRIKKVLLVLIPVLILAGAAFAVYRQYNGKQYSGYEVKWEKDLAENPFSSYVAYGSNVLKYSQDGASYIDSSGNVVWSEAYEMRSPIVAVRGSYAALAESEGRRIYIFDETGCQGKIETTLPVTSLTIAETGMTAVLLEDGDVSYIDFFDKTGARLDIEKKMWMGGEGYPISMQLSPSGTQMILSCVYMDAGTMQNYIAFLNFSEAGENLTDRTSGVYELGSTVCPQVVFLQDTKACAFLDNGITFYSMEELSTKNPLSPEQGASHTFAEEIRSVFYSDEYVGVITNSGESNVLYELHVFTADGEIKAQIPINYEYISAQFSVAGICLYDQMACHLYTVEGQLKYEGELGGSIHMLTGKGRNRLLRIGDQKVTEVALK